VCARQEPALSGKSPSGSIFAVAVERGLKGVADSSGESGAAGGSTSIAPRRPFTEVASPSQGSLLESPSPPVTKAADLTALLERAFGFKSFLPNQEAVCRAVIEGRDVLLVMPTGSGKSLCYQLPAIARGGTTLVVSPLIALMEDQVFKLKARGFAVERIHSGRPRPESRQACRDYLAGNLQFLFIAPERLRVAGFPEMLAKRPVALIVVDEAHCISQWGHDFRPDYRQLGKYVPGMRPAPVIALTATATPPVQKDIVEQLALAQPALFIHGFRRANIAIESVEVAPSERSPLTRELLADPGRRPAIVYTPTRKQAEALAGELCADHQAAAYHAGLDAQRRKQVQDDFLAGKLEIIVATIAFGMGIDKPDIRTVVHTALPGSIEAYYQEIGRAGRDGQPSRALLMHSYADRYTHDFFFERDYPDAAILDGIFALLKPEPQPKSELQKRTHLDAEGFDRALEKLWAHGGAVVDFAENIRRGSSAWRGGYLAQAAHKRQQIELMIRYAEGNQCRMSNLVRHFGDFADGAKPCGICDYCAPAQCKAQRFRTASAVEQAAVWRVTAELRAAGARSTGRLYAELFPHKEMSRDDFENLLGGMARAGIVRLEDAIFEKEGRQIPYRTTRLTQEGEQMDAKTSLNFFMKDSEPPATPRPRKRKPKGGGAAGRMAGPEQMPAHPSMPASPTPAPAAQSRRPPGTPSDLVVEEALRAWRLAEARRLGIPAFRIFTDRTLSGLVKVRPKTSSEMLNVPGIGLRTADRYGSAIRRILHPNSKD